MTPHDAMPLVKIATAMAAPEIVLFRMASDVKKAMDENIDRTYRIVDKHLLQSTLQSILDSRRSAISTYLSLTCNTFFPTAGVLYFLYEVRSPLPLSRQDAAAGHPAVTGQIPCVARARRRQAALGRHERRGEGDLTSYYFLVAVRTPTLAPIRSLALPLPVTTPGWPIVMFVAVAAAHTLYKYWTKMTAFRRET